jgi:chemotaxis protein CheX
MQLEHINPFIESVGELFTTMLASKAQRGAPSLHRGDGVPGDVVALIGLSGPPRGTVALSFPMTTSLAIVARLLGMKVTAYDDTVSDAMAELVNIVAGSAKSKMNIDGRAPMDLSLPTVVRGNDYTVDYPKSTMWLEVPFSSDFGPFSLRVTFEAERGSQTAR